VIGELLPTTVMYPEKISQFIMRNVVNKQQHMKTSEEKKTGNKVQHLQDMTVIHQFAIN